MTPTPVPHQSERAETPRTDEALAIEQNFGAIRDAVGNVEDAVTPEEAHNYMVSALTRLARTLERELAAERAAREEVERDLDVWKKTAGLRQFILEGNNNKWAADRERLLSAEAALKEAHERLELTYAYDGAGNEVPFPEGALDGIACRDETIRLLEQSLKEAQRELQRFYSTDGVRWYRKASGQDKPSSPPLPPNQQTAVEEAQRDAFERAVRECEHIAGQYDMAGDDDGCNVGESCAAAIRALIQDKPQESK
jgi:hypothetical protein